MYCHFKNMHIVHCPSSRGKTEGICITLVWDHTGRLHTQAQGIALALWGFGSGPGGGGGAVTEEECWRAVTSLPLPQKVVTALPLLMKPLGEEVVLTVLDPPPPPRQRLKFQPVPITFNMLPPPKPSIRSAGAQPLRIRQTKNRPFVLESLRGGMGHTAALPQASGLGVG